jgi:2-keto-3-deoxy-L-fuconate dehydrogenase
MSASNRLQGKQALVTAAGQGIGHASARALAAAGAQVLATDVNPALLQALHGVPGVRTQVLDVLDKVAIEHTVASLASLDVVFNCAGVVHNGSVAQATDAQWAQGFDLNVRSQFWMIQAALPLLLASATAGRGPSIINMASVCSSIKGLPNRFIYGATKAAVIGVTKAVAADFVGQGLRCNAIAPGTVDTPSLQDRINAHADPGAARAAFIARQPLGRLAQAHEIAPLVVYLASDESAFVTGQVYAIDGGISI